MSLFCKGDTYYNFYMLHRIYVFCFYVIKSLRFYVYDDKITLECLS